MSRVGKIVLDFLEDHDGEELRPEDIDALNKKVIKELGCYCSSHCNSRKEKTTIKPTTIERTTTIELDDSQLWLIQQMVNTIIADESFDSMSLEGKSSMRDIVKKVIDARAELM